MIYEELQNNDIIEVYTTQPLCIYTKTNTSYSECFDTNYNDQLDIDNIDDSYQLEVIKNDDRIDVFIPNGVKCSLKKASPNSDCLVIYKNIKCELVFDEPIDNFFEIID